MREFVATAFEMVGLDYRKHVVMDQQLYRPTEVSLLLGDSTKARRQLKWTNKVGFEDLVREMVNADMEYLKSRRAD